MIKLPNLYQTGLPLCHTCKDLTIVELNNLTKFVVKDINHIEEDKLLPIFRSCPKLIHIEIEKLTLEQNKPAHSEAALVGTRIDVWWEKEKEWFRGKVTDFSVESGKHIVMYDDGDVGAYNNLLTNDKKKWKKLSDEIIYNKIILTYPAENKKVLIIKSQNIFNNIIKHHNLLTSKEISEYTIDGQNLGMV